MVRKNSIYSIYHIIYISIHHWRRIIIDKHIKYSKFDHRYREEKVVMLYNKKGRFYYPVIETAYSKSLLRLRNKLLSANVEWTHHIVFTFSDEKIIYSRRGNVFPTQNIIREDKIERIYSWIKSPKIERFDKASRPPDTNIIYIKQILNRFRNIDKDFLYVWKYEEGRKAFRPHFHLLFRCPKICTFCIWSICNDLWGRGRVNITKVITKMQLEIYIYKDFTKSTTLKYLHNYRRKWSTSRGITKSKQASEFEIKTISHYGYAMKLFESTKENYIDYYKNDKFDIYSHYQKMRFQLKQGIDNYKARLPTHN